MKPLFLFGAGFSKWISPDMPLMSDLLLNIPKGIKQKIDEANLRYIINNNNIEHLISYLHTKYPWKTNQEYYQNLALYSEIIKYLCDTIRTASIISKSNLENSYIEKLTIYWKKHTSCLLTFNYDVFLERRSYNE